MLLKTEWAKIGFNIKKRRFSKIRKKFCFLFEQMVNKAENLLAFY